MVMMYLQGISKKINLVKNDSKVATFDHLNYKFIPKVVEINRKIISTYVAIKTKYLKTTKKAKFGLKLYENDKYPPEFQPNLGKKHKAVKKAFTIKGFIANKEYKKFGWVKEKSCAKAFQRFKKEQPYRIFNVENELKKVKEIIKEKHYTSCGMIEIVEKEAYRRNYWNKHFCRKRLNFGMLIYLSEGKNNLKLLSDEEKKVITYFLHEVKVKEINSKISFYSLMYIFETLFSNMDEGREPTRKVFVLAKAVHNIVTRLLEEHLDVLEKSKFFHHDNWFYHAVPLNFFNSDIYRVDELFEDILKNKLKCFNSDSVDNFVEDLVKKNKDVVLVNSHFDKVDDNVKNNTMLKNNYTPFAPFLFIEIALDIFKKQKSEFHCNKNKKFCKYLKLYRKKRRYLEQVKMLLGNRTYFDEKKLQIIRGKKIDYEKLDNIFIKIMGHIPNRIWFNYSQGVHKRLEVWFKFIFYQFTVDMPPKIKKRQR